MCYNELVKKLTINCFSGKDGGNLCCFYCGFTLIYVADIHIAVVDVQIDTVDIHIAVLDVQIDTVDIHIAMVYIQIDMVDAHTDLCDGFLFVVGKHSPWLP